MGNLLSSSSPSTIETDKPHRKGEGKKNKHNDTTKRSHVLNENKRETLVEMVERIRAADVREGEKRERRRELRREKRERALAEEAEELTIEEATATEEEATEPTEKATTEVLMEEASHIQTQLLQMYISRSTYLQQRDISLVGRNTELETMNTELEGLVNTYKISLQKRSFFFEVLEERLPGMIGEERARLVKGKMGELMGRELEWQGPLVGPTEEESRLMREVGDLLTRRRGEDAEGGEVGEEETMFDGF